MIGQTLSHYRITAALGAGGMGEVYRATDTNLNRDVAIKVLPPEVAGDAERLARFKREAHLLASLNHPHIAAIYALEEAHSKGIDPRVSRLAVARPMTHRARTRRGPGFVSAAVCAILSLLSSGAASAGQSGSGLPISDARPRAALDGLVDRVRRARRSAIPASSASAR